MMKKTSNTEVRAALASRTPNAESGEGQSTPNAQRPTSNAQLQRPIDRAEALYEIKRAERMLLGEEHSPFAAVLRHYMDVGVVRSTNRSFVMARVVEFALPETGRRTAAWLCCCGVGSLTDMVRGMPYHLPYIAFVRRGESTARYYATHRFFQLSMNTQPSTKNPQLSEVCECQ